MKETERKKTGGERFLPADANDMRRRGWDAVDFVLVTGDAYVDHPSFGHAIISRLLEAEGYRVGIIAQPDWRSTEDFLKLGRPRIGALVSSGNLDSIVANYAPSGRRRRTDDYAPGGEPGKRPDHAVIVYCNRVRELWKDIPLIIGGIEASLRRFAHYDFKSRAVRRSILADSRADLLLYGMAERAIVEVAKRLARGESSETIRDVAGTCWKTHDRADAEDAVEIPSFADVVASKECFAAAFGKYYAEQDPIRGASIVQDQGAWWVVQNPPAMPLEECELDAVYALPYARAAYPGYEQPVPALEEVRFSVTAHRGCFGECAFCAISTHQGRIIQTRSDDGIVAEVRAMTKAPGFKGYIHDVGGPSANFHARACAQQVKHGACRGKSCLYPRPCPKLRADHGGYIALLRKLRALPGVKKVFIRSGLRYDYILADDHCGKKFLEELCRHHVSGQLKIAPEHVGAGTLAQMRKPGADVTMAFIEAYGRMNGQLGMKQYLVPYFMSGHPGSTLTEAIALAEFMRDNGLRPEQAQEFTPTPGTPATCAFYSGIDPFTGKRVHVPDDEEREMQRALLQYWMPQNGRLVKKALECAGRKDLIGKGKHCLIPAGGR